MIRTLRADFNQRFNKTKYAELLRRLNEESGTAIKFPVAETPVFLPPELLDEIVTTGAELTHQLMGNAEALRRSAEATPHEWRVPGEDAHPHFMAVDFGLVRNEEDRLRPKLVELQAFPSVFGYQALLSRMYIEVYGLNPGLRWFLNGMNEDEYWQLLREVIVGEHAVENVILAEVELHTQKTLPDFRLHEKKLRIRSVDVASLRKDGRKLLYERDGVWTQVKRIYNRVIVDELVRKNFRLGFDYRDELDVEWAGHPNWYFRVSKFSLPFLRHASVPGAVFLDDWIAGNGRDRLPEDPARRVLKPLYSFAGKGIEFAPTENRLLEIPVAERGQYLLQERVRFEPVVETPEGPTQAEVRIMYVWPEKGRLTPTISLVRMGRGLMMGVDHNKDQAWVGGSAGLFPGI